MKTATQDDDDDDDGIMMEEEEENHHSGHPLTKEEPKHPKNQADLGGTSQVLSAAGGQNDSQDSDVPVLDAEGPEGHLVMIRDDWIFSRA